MLKIYIVFMSFNQVFIYFYGDLVYKLKELMERLILVINFKKLIKRYKRVGYNMDIMQYSACVVVNSITVGSYGFLFNCTTMGQASDLMSTLT